MPDLLIGNTTIPYTVRRSERANRKRIVVTPQAVEVVIPTAAPDQGPDSAQAFITTKRTWVFNAVLDCQQHAQQITPARYESGAKLPYRGRNLMLAIEPAAVDHVEITCQSRFRIRYPRKLKGSRHDQAISAAMDCWLRERCLQDATRLTNRHAKRLQVDPGGVRLSNSRHYWGTCGKDHVVRIHADLIQAPAAAFEYVVAHEVAHLLERNHSPRFWRILGSTLSDWQARKALLESWEQSGDRRRHRDL